MGNVKAVMLRNATQGDSGLLALALDSWKESLKEMHRTGEGQGQLQALQNQLNKFNSDQAGRRKGVMARMGAGQDSGLIAMSFNSWKQFHQNYAKDKEFEEAVKRSEAQIKAHMAKKKEDAKQVLDRMSGATETGLLQQVFTSWISALHETQKAQELEDKMNGAGGKFKSLRDRQSANASGVQGRVNEQMKMNLLLRCVKSWQIESRVNKENSEFNRKLDQKRKQLKSVQHLFKEFARQLEEGLGAVDGDSSGRRSNRSIKNKSIKDSKGGGTVSLPDIHQKQNGAAYPAY